MVSALDCGSGYSGSIPGASTKKGEKMSKKRFFTNYSEEEQKYNGYWRIVKPMIYDGDKYVLLDNGERIKLGNIRHGRPMGPRVSRSYALRFFLGVDFS